MSKTSTNFKGTKENRNKLSNYKMGDSQFISAYKYNEIAHVFLNGIYQTFRKLYDLEIYLYLYTCVIALHLIINSVTLINQYRTSETFKAGIIYFYTFIIRPVWFHNVRGIYSLQFWENNWAISAFDGSW